MPRRATQHDWNRFHNAAERRSDKLLQKYADGKLDADALHDAYLEMLADRHGYASYLGRRRGGDLAPRDEDDRKLGEVMAEDQDQYLAAFIDDLRAGRYKDAVTGKLLLGAVLNRGSMYVERMLGTANEAFVGTSYATQETYTWRLGGTENHCSVCPERDGLSWAWDALPSYPGDGGTPCLTRCLCYLVRSDGIRGFLPA